MQRRFLNAVTGAFVLVSLCAASAQGVGGSIRGEG
jgi:hypothetical protein